VSGRKYMYICVVNLLGRLVGVIQRVKGTRLSIKDQSLLHKASLG
jgi:hypothetical protein